MEASALPRSGLSRVPGGRALLATRGDDVLVEQVRAGNERAFEVIYDRHHRGLLAFCRHMLGSAEEAEDALQQVFVSAHADLLRSRRPLALKAWLYTIARNRCLSMLRARREHSSAPVEPATEGVSEQVERWVELQSLLGDMRELPDQQRAALVLAEVGDLSHAEIAQVIGCEAVRVKALIFQARSALIEARKAREAPCSEIREQLATLRGGELRRGELRRHLKVCQGCTEFRDEVRRQRAMMALLLPVVPSVGLKRSVLAAAGVGSASAGAGAGGAGLVAGVAAKSGVAKLVTACLLGGAALGGGVALHEHGALPFASSHHHVPSAANGSPAAPTRAAAPTVAPAGSLPGAQALPGHRAHTRAPGAAGHAHKPAAHGRAQQHSSGTQRALNPIAASHRHAGGLSGSKAHTHRSKPAHPQRPARKPPTQRRTRPITGQQIVEQPAVTTPVVHPGRALGSGD
jgi:RNA polymerase sigma factor (sigma-70 family)